jgi:hypothetical protein
MNYIKTYTTETLNWGVCIKEQNETFAHHSPFSISAPASFCSPMTNDFFLTINPGGNEYQSISLKLLKTKLQTNNSVKLTAVSVNKFWTLQSLTRQTNHNLNKRF